MSDDAERFRHFKPPGPVASAFLADRTSKVRGILGPVGGGKTVTCAFDTLVNAQEMPLCLDNKIHHRHVIIGSTYGQIERNLYPTWFAWFPKQGDNFIEAEWEGGGGRFGRHMIRTSTLRAPSSLPERIRQRLKSTSSMVQVPIDLEVLFAAVGEGSVESFVRGFEPTSAHLYEVDQLPANMVSNIVGRLGRYPSASMLGHRPNYRTYVVCDYNAPDVDNWTVKDFDEEPLPGFKLYRQPSGLSPRAENTQNLPDGYYEELARLNAKNTRWVRRFIHVQYGPSDAGDPVFATEFSDDVHVSAQPLVFDKSRPLLLGFDQDLHPACLIGQRTSLGQLRILAEIAPEGRTGARRFAQMVKAVLGERFAGFQIGGAWADPAGFDGADAEGDELAWAEIVSEELGFPILPAPSNEPELRLQAVRDELTFMVEAGVPALMLSRGHTPKLRKGFVSHYMFDKRPLEKQQVRRPIKNPWANPQDALQYLIVGERGRYAIVEGKRAGRDGAARQRADDSCVTLAAPVVI